MKVLFGSDMQIPFEDKRAVALWLKVQKAFKPDHIVLPGDIEDQEMYSRWVNGGSQEFINLLPDAPTGDTVFRQVFENARRTKEFYTQIRQNSPDAEFDVALGNHDIRVFDYMDKKFPDLKEHVTPNSLWDFDNLGIAHTMYADRPKHLFGGLHVHHGVSISKHGGESVRNDVDNFGVSLVRGHSHRLAEWHRSYPLLGKTLSGYEIGHMMDIHSSGASYDNVHNWQLGFAIAHVEPSAGTEDGLYPHMQLISITQDYTCCVDGKVFKG